MKRILMTLLCVALMGAACGDGDDDPAATTTSETATTATTVSGATTAVPDASDAGDGTDDTSSTRAAFLSILTDAGLDEAEAQCLADRFLTDGAGGLDVLDELQQDPASALSALSECGISLADIDELVRAFTTGGLGDSGAADGGGDGLGFAESAFVDALVASLGGQPEIDEDEARCIALALLEEGGGIVGAGELTGDLASLQDLLAGCGVSPEDLTG